MEPNFNLLAVGRRSIPDRFVDRIWRTADQFAFNGVAHVSETTMPVGDDSPPVPVLLVELHPAVPPVFIALPYPNRMQFFGQTAAGGPGYHQQAIAFARKVASSFGLALQFDDEAIDTTGYFGSGKRDRLEAAMLDWLKETCTKLLEQPEAESPHSGLGVPESMRFREPKAFLHTPRGPRSVEWLRAVAEDPRLGIEVFPWWDAGSTVRDLIAGAEALMWVDVRWKRAVSENDDDLLATIHNALTTAHRKDPGAALPWREWAEVIRLSDGQLQVPETLSRTIEERAAAATGPLIGYRRGPVRYRLSSRWVELPGSFVNHRDPYEFVAADGDRSVHISMIERQTPDGALKSLEDVAAEGDTDTLDRAEGSTMLAPIDEPHRRGGAEWFEREEHRHEHDDDDCDCVSSFVLQGYVAFEGELGVVTVIVKDKADLPWAESVWRSIR